MSNRVSVLRVFAFVSVLGLGLLELLGGPPKAQACSCATTVLDEVDPQDGASSIPLDYAPVIQGNIDPQSVRLQTASGLDVPITVEAVDGIGLCAGITVEITPISALQPDTQYTITASSPTDQGSTAIEESSSFTTGADSSSASSLQAPSLVASATLGNPNMVSCRTGVDVCLFIDGTGQYEVVLQDANGQAIGRAFVDGDASYPLLASEVPDCIEVRARDSSGRRSDPARICGNDVAKRDAVDSDYGVNELGEPVWLCDHGLIGLDTSASSHETADASATREASSDHSSRSCSIAAPGHSDLDRPSLLAITLVTALLERRRKRAKAY